MDHQEKNRGGVDEPLAAAAVLRKIEELLNRTMARERDEVTFRMTRQEHHDLRGGLNALGLLAYLGEIELAKEPGPSPESFEGCSVETR